MSFRQVVCVAILSAVPAAAFASLQLPNDITVEATQNGGAEVKYSVSIVGPPEDDGGRSPHTVTCSPASLSIFAIGTTTVSCNATDGSTGNFNVTVRDTTAPQLFVPRDFAVFTTGTSQVADFSQWVYAVDRVDGSPAVTCNPPSGYSFLVGETPVTCTTSDSRGNATTRTFDVIVYNTLPNDFDKAIKAEATGPNGAVVTFDDAPCSPASGSTLPLGITLVTCSTYTFHVTVVDTTPPALTLPPNLTATTTNASGTAVTYSASASDIVDGSVAVTCSPASGSLFPVGTTTVNCSATDSSNNSASGSFSVTVTQQPDGDDEAPVFVSLTATPNILTPANNKLVDVALSADVTDNEDPAPLVQIYDVTSNEQINGDFAITGALTLQLRAERDGNNQGRTYTIWVEAVDDAGNRGIGSVTVTVPHDQGNSSTVTPAPPTRRRAAGKG